MFNTGTNPFGMYIEANCKMPHNKHDSHGGTRWQVPWGKVSIHDDSLLVENSALHRSQHLYIYMHLFLLAHFGITQMD